MTDSSLGEGYDFVWSSATLNFAKGRLTEVFRKIYAAMIPGGVFASYHPSISSYYKPQEMVVQNAPLAVLGINMQFYGDEIPNAMLEAGFHTVQSKYISTCFGEQRLDIARKAREF